ncbi:hypothetical protein SADUNF_Sadunf06G0128000 [Salix dunnii]|uniref:Uncharacterized protein n=1 Tax=Salix dunnii TaxID=1413687 RepID=A0A835K432_9ROSI|nr:hypothetical protein SADUNF_Sadunf06G0128000 [Salix dunnii]
MKLIDDPAVRDNLLINETSPCCSINKISTLHQSFLRTRLTALDVCEWNLGVVMVLELLNQLDGFESSNKIKILVGWGLLPCLNRVNKAKP